MREFSDIEKKLGTFTGERHENFVEWLQKFENLAKKQRWDEIQKFVYCRKLMKSTARMFLSCTRGLTNWRALKKGLVEEFIREESSAVFNDESDDEDEDDSEDEDESSEVDDNDEEESDDEVCEKVVEEIVVEIQKNCGDRESVDDEAPEEVDENSNCEENDEQLVEVGDESLVEAFEEIDEKFEEEIQEIASLVMSSEEDVIKEDQLDEKMNEDQLDEKINEKTDARETVKDHEKLEFVVETSRRRIETVELEVLEDILKEMPENSSGPRVLYFDYREVNSKIKTK
ncbi:nucleolin-like [Lutzomyia longipalpis]|uniref:nucleolin-like n=1 Tax=Lutzomyia longipalpis TaxID=7200 RepID=UPI0024838503|nr:nucleolin-like [Lutzomyia longipalpis]